MSSAEVIRTEDIADALAEVATTPGGTFKVRGGYIVEINGRPLEGADAIEGNES